MTNTVLGQRLVLWTIVRRVEYPEAGVAVTAQDVGRLVYVVEEYAPEVGTG